MASSALGLLEPGPFSSHVLLRSWPGSGSQGSISVKAGGRHSSRTELVLPWASWRLGPLPESPGPGRLSAPHLPARSEGATLRLQATQPHRLPVASPGPGVHSLCIRSCQWAGELRVHAFLGARLPAVLWVHTCAPGCQATSKDAWVGPSQPCSSRSRLRQAPCTHYWACTNLLGQWPGSVQGAQGDSGRVGSALLGGGCPAGWARHCLVGGPADPAEDIPQSSWLLGEPSCPAQTDVLALRVLLPWDCPLASWAQQLRGPWRAEPLGAPGQPRAWNISAAPWAVDTWIAFLFKPTFVVCVSFSPLPALFI